MFARLPGPPVLALALAGALAARLLAGHASWRDAVLAAGLVAATPFVEWAIHVYLLHSRPLRLAGHSFDLPTTREHRAHHLAPGFLEGVLLPVYGLVVFLAMIAAVMLGLAFALAAVTGGRWLELTLTGIVAGWAILAAYEWTHFLIHTPYRPRGRYYRAIWRNHRLHHYKNERYWFGVTSTVGDRAIGTLPDQRGVPRSATARSLAPGS